MKKSNSSIILRFRENVTRRDDVYYNEVYFEVTCECHAELLKITYFKSIHSTFDLIT